ncbi:hypothetical protein DESAMIL20_383 [Desulfurella amilsii]|uniref:NRDE family protein n=1 Tax=Desulfurella amilsii TaxID=1562698 RepID=A0A1X4XZ72_9BACT|nr:NRDE family protein [Desulfurella amilsii]OSS42763.1 hypothetical protein DESAMIL20_459 [Desulfurella amilsii]OSS42839.1 hypothetical protein DESAMIL20_383 [Desulfurella amilsii]
MCLVVFALNKNPKYKLILAGNRDEYYARKSLPFKWYKSETDELLSPRDLLALGSFFGITKNGKLVFLTNYRNPDLFKTSAPSRGRIVWDYLTANVDPKRFIRSTNPVLYNPFNLVFGSIDCLYYFSNIQNQLMRIKSGLHTLSNSLLDISWPKTKKAKAAFENDILYAQDKKLMIKQLFKILYDDTVFEDSLPSTGIDLMQEKMLSSIFVKSKNYGTQTSYVLLIDYNNNAVVIEKNHILQTNNEFHFCISPKGVT